MPTTVEDDLLQFRDLLRVEAEDVGLPHPLLRGVKDLIGCDLLSFNRMDSTTRTHAFQQEDDGDSITLIPEDIGGPDDPFWWHYWTSSCSYPDRSGDLTSVTMASDFHPDLELRAQPMYSECFAGDHLVHEMMMVLPDGGPGRSLRLILFRGPGSDFTERDRFYLQLLRPHFADAFARSEAHRTADLLTPRQVDILGYVRLGMTNRQIGRRLDIAEGTVRTHMRDVFERLDVTSRTAAVHRAAHLLKTPATPL